MSILLFSHPGKMRAGHKAALLVSISGILFGLQAVLAAQPTPRLTVEQIIERHVTARGGLPAWRAVHTLSITGSMDAGTGDNHARSEVIAREGIGATVKSKRLDMVNKAQAIPQVQLPFTLEMMRPNKSRLEIVFAGKTAVQVFDGTNGWKLRPFLNRNDVEPFTADEAKSETGKDLEGPLLDYAARGTKVAFEAVESVDGHDAYRLKLTPKSGDIQHIWIDSQSFLDVKVDGVPRRMDGRMRQVWIHQRDFRPVQGLTIPFLYETEVEGAAQVHKMTVQNVVVNPSLDASRFSKPVVLVADASATSSATPPAGSTVTSVPAKRAQ